MSIKTTKQSLGIFWDGEEIDGLIAYGIWADRPTCFPSICQNIGGKASEERQSELYGEGWYVRIWDIKIDDWPLPSEWRSRIQNMLHDIIDAGAKVAWTGTEGTFVDPPDLFNPIHMEASVWAAMTQRGNFYFHAELLGEFKMLGNDELSTLRSLVPGVPSKHPSQDSHGTEGQV